MYASVYYYVLHALLISAVCIGVVSLEPSSALCILTLYVMATGQSIVAMVILLCYAALFTTSADMFLVAAVGIGFCLLALVRTRFSFAR